MTVGIGIRILCIDRCSVLSMTSIDAVCIGMIIPLIIMMVMMMMMTAITLCVCVHLLLRIHTSVLVLACVPFRVHMAVCGKHRQYRQYKVRERRHAVHLQTGKDLRM